MTGNQLKEFREESKLTQTELSKKLNVSLKTVQNWEAERNKIPHHIVLMVAQLAGKQSIEVPLNSEGKGTPFYPGVYSTGSVVSLFMDDHDEKPLFYLDAPEIQGCDCGFRVSGDSMHPLIKNGGYVACKTIHNKESILYGEIYHIITPDYRTVKYIHPHPTKEDWVLLVPYNSSIPETPMPRKDIIRLAQVRGIFQAL